MCFRVGILLPAQTALVGGSVAAVLCPSRHPAMSLTALGESQPGRSTGNRRTSQIRGTYHYMSKGGKRSICSDTHFTCVLGRSSPAKGFTQVDVFGQHTASGWFTGNFYFGECRACVPAHHRRCHCCTASDCRSLASHVQQKRDSTVPNPAPLCATLLLPPAKQTSHVDEPPVRDFSAGGLSRCRLGGHIPESSSISSLACLLLCLLKPAARH